MSTPAPRYQDLPFGITCIDTELVRHGHAACYLIRGGDEYAFIDTGTPNSVPLLLEVVRRKGIAPHQVTAVMPTHVHLDHAGGTGALLAAFPDARLIVHPRGARHLIDPTRLEAGALAVYGEARFAALFGHLQPVDPARVTEASDGFSVDLGDRRLVFMDTPGHARHHYVVYDEHSRGLFTGDTFGASYPELNGGRRPFIFPPTTPIQFDPIAWSDTLDRLMTLQPKRVFLTHFGMHEQPEKLVLQLKERLREYVAIAEDLRDASDRQPALAAALMHEAVNALLDSGCGLAQPDIESALAPDMGLNAQGLDHWLATAA